MQNAEAAQSVDRTECHCPEDKRKILVLAVAPFSGTRVPLLSCSRLCPCQKLCLLGLFLGFSRCIWSKQKEQAVLRGGKSDHGTRAQQDAGEVCHMSEQVGMYLKHMHDIARRKSWGSGSGVWGVGPPSPVQLRKVHFLPWCYTWLEEYFFFQRMTIPDTVSSAY